MVDTGYSGYSSMTTAPVYQSRRQRQLYYLSHDQWSRYYVAAYLAGLGSEQVASDFSW